MIGVVTHEPFGLLILSSFLSISTTFLNKGVTQVFPSVFLVLFIQNLFGVLVTYSFFSKQDTKWKEYKELPKNILLYTFLISIIFMIMLWSSMTSLGKGSVSLNVVTKSCLPLCTAILEPLYFYERRNPRTYIWLILMVFVALWIGKSDPTATFSNIIFAFINLLLTSLLSIIERLLIKIYKSKISVMQIVTLRNLWSLPIAIFFFYVTTEDLSSIMKNFFMWNSLSMILLSSFFANGLALTSFYLKSKTTSTTLAVFNAGSKILSIAIDRFFFFYYTFNWLLSVPLVTYIILIILYSRDEENFPRVHLSSSQSAKRKSQIITSVVLIILISALLCFLLFNNVENKLSI